MLARVEQINAKLKTFKGVGRLDIETPERHQTARIVWAGDLIDRRVRLDVIGAGLPAASMAADGRHVYLRDSADGSVRSRASANADLNGLLSLPVTVDDVLCALAGRLPDLAGDRTDVHPGAGKDELVLLFSRHFGAPLAQAGVDSSGERLHHVAFFHRNGDLDYRIDYLDHRIVGGYRLPHRIEIRDARSVLRIRVDRWWTDVVLDAAMFVLTAPDR